MPANLGTVTAILKESYETGIEKQIDDEVITLRRVERTSEGVTSDIGGKYVVFAIHTRRNGGIGARAENEALPVAGQQGTAAGRVNLSYLYGSIELTGQLFELANSKPEIFIDAVDLEMDGLKADLAKDLNRQMYGNGSGRQATATTAGGVLNTIDYLWLGAVYDVIDAAGTVKASGRTLTAVNETTKVPTLSGAAITWAVGDSLVRAGSYNKEMIGFDSIISDTGTLYNINPATEPSWKAVVNANGGTPRALSETLLIATNNRVRKNGGSVTAMYAPPPVWVAYWNLLVAQRQFVNKTDYAGGYSGLAFHTDKGEIPFVQDFDAPAGTIWGVNEKALKLYREHAFKFMDRDGNMWQRKITTAGTFDAYQATSYQYAQLGTNRRNSHFKISDIIGVE